jgi:hypothetical protein
MGNDVHCWVGTFKDAWRLWRQMSHLSVQTKLETVSSNLHYYFQKQVQLLNLLSMKKYIVLLQFLNEVSTVTFLFIFIIKVYILKFSIYLCSDSFRATFCFTNPDDFLPPAVSGTVYSALLWAVIYCIPEIVRSSRGTSWDAVQTTRWYNAEHHTLHYIQSDSKLLSGFLFIGHGNTDNNLESPCICLSINFTYYFWTANIFLCQVCCVRAS